MKPLYMFRNAFILTMLFIFVGVAGFSPTASADTYQIPPQIYINDKYIGFDVSPVIENGHTLVPVKKFFENIGVAATWDESTQQLTASNSTTTAIFTIGSYNVIVNGKIKCLDEPVQIIEGQTFAPLAFVVGTFDCQMNFDMEKMVFKIYYGSKMQKQMAAVPATKTPPEQVPANPVSAPTTEQTEPQNQVSAATAEQTETQNAAPPAVEQSGPVMAVSVKAADLHIRSGPSTSSDVIGLVPCGTMLAYVGEDEGWYQVKFQGRLGWVASWYCTPPSTASVPASTNQATLLPAPSDPEAFVRQMKPYAEIAHKGTSLPVNFLLAQWAEECGYGTSSLALYYNNFGGIKAPGGGFQQYATPDEFARDVIRLYTEYSQFARLLADARNGASLQTLFNDLSRSGYASSSSYGEKIRTQYLPTIDEVLKNIK